MLLPRCAFQTGWPAGTTPSGVRSLLFAPNGVDSTVGWMLIGV
jgi:hypothetical protein